MHKNGRFIVNIHDTAMINPLYASESLKKIEQKVEKEKKYQKRRE